MRASLSLGSALLPALVPIALALAGCAVGPIYREPTPAAPAIWHTALPHDGSVGAMENWWQQFDDPVLGRLIELAEADSPSLTKAWARIEKARATLTTAQAAGLPSVDAQGSVSRARQQSFGSALTTTTTRSAGLDASWELDLFGKVRSSADAAQARIEARVDDWHDARVSLAAEVADTYVQYRGCGLLTEAYERELDSTQQTEQATAASVAAGFTAPADGALARAAVASTSSTLASQRAQCELLVKSLVSLTGTGETALRAMLAEGRKTVPQPAALEVDSVPAQVLRQRPDLASRERELAAASAEIGVAQADLYPSLSLAGSITVSAGSLTSTLTTWSFGPSLSIPLFDGGKRRAAVDSARASYTAADADYRQSVRDVVKEVEQALVRLDSAAQRAGEAARAAQEYRHYFAATEQNWRAGGTSLLSLEESRRSALTAEIDLITLQRDRVEYWIALYKALGGGWQTNTPALSPEALAAANAQQSNERGAQ
jgi:outer membrane protein, multidrug efflux system